MEKQRKGGGEGSRGKRRIGKWRGRGRGKERRGARGRYIAGLLHSNSSITDTPDQTLSLSQKSIRVLEQYNIPYD